MMEFYQDEQDKEDFKKWLNSDRDAKYERDAKIIFYVIVFGFISIGIGFGYLMLSHL